ncbi:MAG TPA: tetratricopeptide repeat protein [Pirellulales bacterium]|nr:tetratricopeptide repeat protein [Pirellulales bacterium]
MMPRFAKIRFSLVWSLLRHCFPFLLGAHLGFSAVLAGGLLWAADLRQGEKLYRTGQYAESIEFAAKSISGGEATEAFFLLKLKGEMTLGRYADARATLETALGRFPYSAPLHWTGRDVYRFNNLPDRAARLAEAFGQHLRQSAWRYRDAAAEVVVGRFMLSLGVDPKKVLDSLYNDAKRQQPVLVDPWLASGELALEKNDFALAAELFERATKLAPDEPDAQFGLARAFAPSDPKLAQDAVEAALAINPRHVDSLLFLVDDHVDSERYTQAHEVLARVRQINPEHPLHWAYLAVLAHLNNEPEKENECRQAALRSWPANPAVDHLIGSKLSQKYRFAEGARYQRQALQFDADFLPAKIQLAQDLLRLGDEADGWPLATEVYDKDGYNVLAHNLVTLHDSLGTFRTLEADGFLVRMEAREAEIYGPRVLDLLKRANERLCEKYEVKIAEPVLVELFPRQQDFAIRTFGLPGGAGFLGVCFGRVITANSPASQGEHPTNWEATLWHEFCHVVTLHKTANKMPRWLSEGISVYEERQADPTWGQTINPRYREMMLGDDLTPVSQLSGAFLHPPTPLHLQFAYYESSLVVEFFIEKYGLPTLKRVLVDLGVGMPINDSLARYAGSLEALDREFAAFAAERAKQMAPKADWAEPKLPAAAGTKAVAAWLKEHPDNYRALGRLASQLITEKQWRAALEPLEKMAELYPEDTGAGNPYTGLATVYRELGDTKHERAALERIVSLTDDNVDALNRLMELSLQSEDWGGAAAFGDRLLAINPLRPAPYRGLATAADHLGNHKLAIDSWRALLLLDPLDPAEAHYQLATLLHRCGDLKAARRQALEALEEAPRYRAAQRELLAIIAEMDGKEQPQQNPKTQQQAPSPQKANTENSETKSKRR